MDILAARKKAAEQVKARQQASTTETGPEPRPAVAPVLSESTVVRTEPGEPEQPAPEPAATAPAPAAAPAEIEAASEQVADASPTGDSTEEPVSREVELLSFRLGAEEYAVEVEDVREVLKVFQLTRVPNSPDYILGVMSLRGTVLPVIDLGMRLGIEPASQDEKARIIVVSTDEGDTGLLVNRVTGVFRILPDEVKPAPEHIEQGAEFLRGIARKNDKLYILLDLEKAVAV